jgi:hypothetical protein
MSCRDAGALWDETRSRVSTEDESLKSTLMDY